MRGSLEEFARLIREGKPFAFSRWGDGEWSCVLGKEGRTCDGQVYSARLRRALAEVLESRPSYYLGMQRLARVLLGGQIDEWLRRRGLSPDWVDADVFHRASIRDELGPLVDALRGRNVIMVGPEYLRCLSLFPVAEHVDVPERAAYEVLRKTPLMAQLRETCRRHRRPLVAVSAGPAAKVIVHQVPRVIAAVDFGSLWDPYVGRRTRKYHRRIVARLGK